MKLVMNIFLPCACLIALTCEAVNVAIAHQLRRSQSSNNEELEQPKKNRDQRVMDGISQFRAEICANMKKEHGMEFKSAEACKKFMDDACNPGSDESMDGDGKEVTSEKGYCTEFFPAAKKKAEEKVDKEDKEEAEKSSKPTNVTVALAPAPGPASGMGPAPAPASPAPSPPAGPAPAPGPMAAPAAPVPAPFVPGISDGKPWGTIPDDEKYYYKKGGKDPSRLHMSAEMKVPEQGYWGKLVDHEDQKSVTGDWGREFGSESGYESVEAFCRQHPDNPWCLEHFPRHKSIGAAVSLDFMRIACLAFVAICVL